MEVNSFSCDVEALGKIVLNSVLETVVAETFLVAQRSVACLLMLYEQKLTKVPLRPYLRGNPGLLPQAISSQDDISVVKGVEDCNGQTGCLLKDGAPPPELVSTAPLSDLVSPDRRFPFEALINQKSEACTENKDGSDTENDDEDDDGDAEDQDDDDDANDEDFSGEEGGDDDDCEGDPEDDPTANGNEGSDDDDDDNDDEDGDDEEGDDDEEEEEEEDDEEDEDQPPAKKRK